MRGAASLGYLLARTSDTLADSAEVRPEARMLCLDWFSRSIAGEEELPRWPLPLLNGVRRSAGKALAGRQRGICSIGWIACPEKRRSWCARWWASSSAARNSISSASPQRMRRIPWRWRTTRALDDYAWRVAGCVGAFWTKLGFLTMDGRFSNAPPAGLIERGINYGKGLQLVNILRDLPADLAQGRCYLPVADPHDTVALLETHGRWVERASEWIDEGFAYAETLRSRRLAGGHGAARDDRAGDLGTPAWRGLGATAGAREGAAVTGLSGLGTGVRLLKEGLHTLDDGVSRGGYVVPPSGGWGWTPILSQAATGVPRSRDFSRVAGGTRLKSRLLACVPAGFSADWEFENHDCG